MAMKIFLILTIFVLFEVNSVFSAQAMANGTHPDYPGKCYVSPEEIYEPGRHQKKGACENISCDESGWLVYQSCGVKAFSNDQGPCERGDIADTTIPYPDCCKFYFRCKDKNGQEYLEIF